MASVSDGSREERLCNGGRNTSVLEPPKKGATDDNGLCNLFD